MRGMILYLAVFVAAATNQNPARQIDRQTDTNTQTRTHTHTHTQRDYDRLTVLSPLLSFASDHVI